MVESVGGGKAVAVEMDSVVAFILAATVASMSVVGTDVWVGAVVGIGAGVGVAVEVGPKGTAVDGAGPVHAVIDTSINNAKHSCRRFLHRFIQRPSRGEAGASYTQIIWHPPITTRNRLPNGPLGFKRGDPVMILSSRNKGYTGVVVSANTRHALRPIFTA